VQSPVSESKDISYLLRPTDTYIVGDYNTTTPIDTVFTDDIQLPGIVAYDPNSAVNIAARVSGRIEKMYVSYKFQQINTNQKLFDLYSPELLTEQQNFIYLLKNDEQNTTIINAAKQKLILYGMTQKQIDALISTKKTNPVLSIYSPAQGIIQEADNISMGKTGNNESNMQTAVNMRTESLPVKEGDYIKKNEVVFKLLNTKKVWGIFNVLQGYNSLIKLGQSIDFYSELNEKTKIQGRINFIETAFNPADKTNRVRVYLDNTTLKLPIGTRLQGRMKTKPIKAIWIQKQAFVSIGDKKIVFLKKDKAFQAKEIKIGVELNDFVQVLEGISVHDTIAENAQYLTDSESFIKIK
ncbi:MAG: efflux RND transporter periplasmic adaptor subunit, partial [Saprospiraceae bacterium]|nr:efflux RND transporter periplasmic adaptor subunit [Saprospiraceae bacterium]